LNENYLIRIKYKVDTEIENKNEKSLHWVK
jgi:hypothetical protein